MVMSGEPKDHETRVSLLEFGQSSILGRLSELKEVLDRVTNALERLATIEERQQNTNEGLGRAFGQIDDQEERIRSIETQLPELNTIKSWVIRGVLAVVSIVGLGTIGAVFSMTMIARKLVE